MAGPISLATWNVNSIKVRAGHVQAWLREAQPSILALQELKTTAEGFPGAEFESGGYHASVHGQKTWNGVALLSKLPFEEVAPGLIGDNADAQARFLEAIVSTQSGVLRVVSLYLPNGNGSEDKYAYKLNWMDRLIQFSHERLKLEEPMLLAGDYNVIPTPLDARRPEAWVNDALFLPPTRARFRALTNLGFTDAIRAVSDEPDLYTFWDYQAGAYQKNDGIRIDHVMLSPQAADKLVDAGIDAHVRGWDKPSDHVPVYVDLAIEAR